MQGKDFTIKYLLNLNEIGMLTQILNLYVFSSTNKIT